MEKYSSPQYTTNKKLVPAAGRYLYTRIHMCMCSTLLWCLADPTPDHAALATHQINQVHTGSAPSPLFIAITYTTTSACSRSIVRSSAMHRGQALSVVPVDWLWRWPPAVSIWAGHITRPAGRRRGCRSNAAFNARHRPAMSSSSIPKCQQQLSSGSTLYTVRGAGLHGWPGCIGLGKDLSISLAVWRFFLDLSRYPWRIFLMPGGDRLPGL
jgi:hypothetical protein